MDRIAACFMRVGLGQMIDSDYGAAMPGPSAVLSTLSTLLKA